ncbi:hypothetical protein RUM44_009108 [Polyplax serrata]|uniref:Secreted protein n=1 Tax=Polyplax serrata TaxID=468196 RepID=A0ABR1ARS0_POLSC
MVGTLPLSVMLYINSLNAEGSCGIFGSSPTIALISDVAEMETSKPVEGHRLATKSIRRANRRASSSTGSQKVAFVRCVS